MSRMFRALPLLVAAAAATAPPRGCARPLRASVEVARLDGTRPEQAILRCRADGGRAPLTFLWKLGPGVQRGYYSMPLDEPTLLVNAASGGVTCSVADAAGQTATAEATLGPMAIARASAPPAVATVTVDGSGFGAMGGTVWLKTAAGALVRADAACKGATWSDARVVVCRPAAAQGALGEVRVESSGRLAVAAPVAK